MLAPPSKLISDQYPSLSPPPLADVHSESPNFLLARPEDSENVLGPPQAPPLDVYFACDYTTGTYLSVYP